MADALKVAPKSKKYKASYSNEMKSAFTFIRKCSSSVPDYQHKYNCTIYNLNLWLVSGGSNDILQHSEMPSHNEKAKYLKSKKLTFLPMRMLFSLNRNLNEKPIYKIAKAVSLLFIQICKEHLMVQAYENQRMQRSS